MTYLTRTVFRLSPFLLLVPLLVGGCSSSPGFCACPLGGAMIELPTDPVASVTADTGCTVSKLGNTAVLIERDGAGSCQVRIQMTSGVTYASEVEFTGGGGCCPYTNFGTAGPLQQLDGGTVD